MSDIFDTQQTKDETSTSALESLVGEGKKFATVEDLAKGKLEADKFIEQLQEEGKELRKIKEDAQSDATSKQLTDLIETLKATKGETSSETKDTQDQMSKEELAKLILDTVDGRNSDLTKKENRQKASELVLQKFKGDAEASKAFVATKAKELGMSVKDLTSLSEQSPQAFAQLVDVEQTKTSNSSTVLKNDVNTSTFDTATAPTQVTVGGVTHNTKAFYDAQRKEMGTAKWLNDMKIQRAYIKDAMALGEDFNKT